nr:hypothetical protein [Tanacetum cinerariifolium]
YRLKNGITKWPTYSLDIDRFCNGGELPGMVRLESMTYFQDHKWYDELVDGKLQDETLALMAKVKGSWGDAAPRDMKNIRIIQLLDHQTAKIKIFNMMKYSFNDDKEYITIKESEYLNHSKDRLDAYREILRLIDEGWVIATPDE